MPREDSLAAFLMKTNQCYLDNTVEFAQKEILRSICSDWEAIYCGVYLKKDNRYQLYSEHALVERASFSFQAANLDLHNRPVYENKRENIHRVVPDTPVQRYLYIPLMQEKKLSGFLLVLWDKPSLFDQCSDTAAGFLLSLALILEKVYAEPSFIQVLHAKEAQLTDLYLTTRQEFDEHLRTTALALHDEIDRMLLAVFLQLEAIQDLNELDLVRGRVAGLQHIVEQSLEKVQQVYTGIHPQLLSRVGLKTALAVHVREYDPVPDMEVRLSITGEAQELPLALETMIYQAARQVLSHLRQQQYRGEVTVRLTVKPGRIFLQITGQDRQIMRNIVGQELAGLHKQAHAAGGKLWLNDQDVQGTSLNVLLPWGS